MFSMHSFDVTVQRIEVREHVFRVEADTKEGAEENALACANDFDFKDGSYCTSNLEVTTVTKDPT
jgi:hypothetical protein